MFRVRVLATKEEIALIAKAARKQRLSVSQFVTGVVKEFGKNLKTRNTTGRRPTFPKPKRPLRKKRKS